MSYLSTALKMLLSLGTGPMSDSSGIPNHKQAKAELSMDSIPYSLWTPKMRELRLQMLWRNWSERPDGSYYYHCVPAKAEDCIHVPHIGNLGSLWLNYLANFHAVITLDRAKMSCGESFSSNAQYLLTQAIEEMKVSKRKYLEAGGRLLDAG